MKLAEEETKKIVSLLADALVSSIGEDKIFKISNDKLLNEIVELVDDIEDRLDSVITDRVDKLRPKKLNKSENWW